MTSAQPGAAEPGLLEGVRVVEITALPGQYTGRLLADFGADVITIEPPRGDPVRSLPPFAHDVWGPTHSLPWLQLNSGKRSLALDLETPDGRDILTQLVETADVLLCSGTAPDLERLGVPFDAPPFGPRADGRARIVATITPYGWTGPKRSFKGTDLIAQAAGGLIQVTGFPNEPPWRVGASIAYQQASIHAAVGTLMALWGVRDGGPSQHVDISLQESVASSVQPEILAWDMRHEVANRVGIDLGRPGAGPFECTDGWVYFQIGPPRFPALVAWMDEHGLAGDLIDPKWEDRQDLATNYKHVNNIIAKFCRTMSCEEITNEGQKRGALIFPVKDALQVINEPQLHARDWFVKAEQRGIAEPVTHPGPPFRLSKRPWRMGGPAPELGEHTTEILAELDPDRFVQGGPTLAALAGAGVIA